MSFARFYIEPSQCDPDLLCLDESESRHCVEVLRHREGDRVVVFDGEGREWVAELVRADRKDVALRVIQEHRMEALTARIVLAQAIPKGKNMELIIQKATELGVAEIVPLVSDRTIVRLSAEESGQRREKWQRVALEACKQCGQNWLPRVHEPVTLERFCAAMPEAELRLVAAIGNEARSLKEILAERVAGGGSLPRSALVMIGPEGDFTPAEYLQTRARGVLPLGLGPIILRSETAAFYALSILAHELR
jgi:16S rRNA (uracil1498-N3)-methyltransferase